MTREDFMRIVSKNIEVVEGVQAEVALYGEKIIDLTITKDDVLGMPFQATKTIINNVSVFDESYEKMTLRDNIIENTVVKSTAFLNLDVYDSGFYNCTFDSVTFYKYDTISKSLFEDCTFKNCIFEGCDMNDNSFNDCTFEGCTFGYCDFEDSRFKKTEIIETVFEKCNHLEFSEDFVFTVTTAK